MKQKLLQLVVIAALVTAALLLRSRDRDADTQQPGDTSRAGETPDTRQTPQESGWSDASRTVGEFFGAAADGDDEEYLSLVSGNLKRSLEENRSELGVDAFRAELVRSASAIMGLATTPGQGAPAGMVAVDVELVFTDRNERQRMLFTREGSDWVITAIEKASMVEPVVPYGTPVFGEPPDSDGTPGADQNPQSSTTE